MTEAGRSGGYAADDAAVSVVVSSTGQDDDSESGLPEGISATDGRVPGRRGQATRRRLLESTSQLLETTAFRSIKVIDIARAAKTSPATFYQYFENVEQAVLVIAEELIEGAADLSELVEGDWSEANGWETAKLVVDRFMDYWERNRAVFRVVDVAIEEGDLRFQGMRVRALNAVTESLARVIDTARASAASSTAVSNPAIATDAAGGDPMAVAATLVSMLAHVAAHRYGFEFWGIRTASMTDVEARIVYWAVTGRSVD